MTKHGSGEKPEILMIDDSKSTRRMMHDALRMLAEKPQVLLVPPDSQATESAEKHPYVSHPESGKPRCLKCGRSPESVFHIQGALTPAPPIAKPQEPLDVQELELTNSTAAAEIRRLRKAEARVSVLEKALRAARPWLRGDDGSTARAAEIVAVVDAALAESADRGEGQE